jgi:2,3-bisphosphoglycerate-independent phosphoglycerate mutase
VSAVRPFVLAIIDGWGQSDDPFGNAIAVASTPVIDGLMSTSPWTTVAASGEAVGLPDGKQGNSEVGHLTIGAGRVIFQPLTRIDRAIRDGSFFDNAALCEAIDVAIRRGTALHLLGLVSTGGVHSDQSHAVALAELAHRRGLDRVHVHAFTDGRDTPPTSGAGFVARLIADLAAVGAGSVASVIGRYYAMDRDHRWDRTQRAYDQLVGSAGDVAVDAIGFIESEYARGVTDEFLPPVSIAASPEGRVRIEDGDTAVFFNFRPDRARQLSHALVDDHVEGFSRSRVVRDLHLVTFTEYERDLRAAVAFPREDVTHTLAEQVSAAGLRQFHVAETEKYAHVTYFINGGREDPFPGEDRSLVPSPRVATYESTPEMSAAGITDATVDRLERGAADLVVLNYANPDMIGHTGDFAATVAAVEVVDTCIGRLEAAVAAAGGAMLITADHGNAEHKIDPADGSPLTAHTTSPVPVILVGAGPGPLRGGGGLADIAPTVLDVMGLAVPAEMTGRSLV